MAFLILLIVSSPVLAKETILFNGDKKCNNSDYLKIKKIVNLESINVTRVHFLYQADFTSPTGIGVHKKYSDNAFYILSKNKKKRFNIIDAHNIEWLPDRRSFKKNQKLNFSLDFEMIDKDVTKIDIIEGNKEQREKYWNFDPIELKRNIKLNDEIIEAAKKGKRRKIQKLINQGVYVDIKDKNGMTPLVYSAYKGYPQIVKILAKAGAEIDLKTNNYLKDTPLILAAREDNLGTVKVLLIAGSDHSIQNTYGNNALMEAASEGHLKIVKKLIENQVDINVANNNGRTALMLAAQAGHLDIVELLINSGAEISKTDIYGLNVFDLADNNKVIQFLKE